MREVCLAQFPFPFRSDCRLVTQPTKRCTRGLFWFCHDIGCTEDQLLNASFCGPWLVVAITICILTSSCGTFDRWEWWQIERNSQHFSVHLMNGADFGRWQWDETRESSRRRRRDRNWRRHPPDQRARAAAWPALPGYKTIHDQKQTLLIILSDFQIHDNLARLKGAKLQISNHFSEIKESKTPVGKKVQVQPPPYPFLILLFSSQTTDGLRNLQWLT